MYHRFLLVFPLIVIAARAQSLGGCAMFPADNVWNARVDSLPLDPNSATYITTIGANAAFHPDFGTNPIYGIPYNLVNGSQPKVPILFGEGASESDPSPYPIPPNALIEGGSSSSGDRHVLVVDTTNCILYEMYSSYPQNDGSWTAFAGAVYHLNSDALRPLTWTSADAAGLPILPGLVRYDEILAGEIKHALRFTVPLTRKAFLWPARHQASTQTGSQYPPMGQRFRLKSSFDVSRASPAGQIILTAMKKYGIILADNGSAWYVTGVSDSRWNDTQMHNDFLSIHGSDFEAVDESGLMVNVNSGQVQVAQQTALAAASISPNGGISLTQTFSATYTDPNGAADLQVTYLTFGASPFATHSCTVGYAQAGKSLYLFSDTNAALGPITLGSNATLSNSQCTLSASGGAAAQAGNSLTVPLALTFTSAFAGSKSIFGMAQSYSGANGGWQTLGTWTPSAAAPIGALPVTPSSGGGTGPQTFSAVFTDPNGAADLQVTYLDFGPASAFTANSCIVAYVQASNALYLFNDSNASVLGPITPGGPGSFSNSQCTLSGSGGPVTTAGNNLTVPVALTFLPAFHGTQKIFGLAQNYSGANGGWQTLGSWTTGLAAVSMNPVNGTGFGPTTFNATYVDPKGAGDLQALYLDFGLSLFGANSCIVAYVPASNVFYLFNDASNGLVPGSVAAGNSGTLSNSQCTISGSGGTVSPASFGLTVPVSITFASTFNNTESVWGLAQSYSGAQSGWQPLGTWKP